MYCFLFGEAAYFQGRGPVSFREGRFFFWGGGGGTFWVDSFTIKFNHHLHPGNLTWIPKIRPFRGVIGVDY